MAAEFTPIAPAERAERVATVHREEATTVMSHLAKAAGAQQLTRLQHHRCPTIIETNEIEHASCLRRASDGCRLFWEAAGWFLTVDVFAGRRRRFDDFKVQEIRCGDIDDIDVWVIDDGAPIGISVSEAMTVGGGLRSLRQGIGTGNQLGSCGRIREAVGNEAVGAAVHLAHPAHADHADAEAWFGHALSPAVPPVAVPAHAARLRGSANWVVGRRPTPLRYSPTFAPGCVACRQWCRWQYEG